VVGTTTVVVVEPESVPESADAELEPSDTDK